MLLLDTSVLARLADDERAESVLPYLTERTDRTWVTSSLVAFEFFRPAHRRRNVREVQAWLGSVLDRIEPFDESAALAATEVEASLAEQDASLAMRDLLIVSHAREIDATFVTVDKGDFQNEPVRQLLPVQVIDP